MKIDKDLEKAILQMPLPERDKLLLRLIRKDPVLIDQLRFNLLEYGETTETRRQAIIDNFDELLTTFSGRYLVSYFLYRCLRSTFPLITTHTKVTKDKAGEVELLLTILLNALKPHAAALTLISKHHMKNLVTLVIQKAARIKKLIGALHEDYRLEFRDDYLLLLEIIDFIPALKAKQEEKGIDLDYDFE